MAKREASLASIEKNIDDLAIIVKKGFDRVDKRFEEVDKRFDQIDKRLELIEARIEHMDARLRMIEMDVAEIRKQLVYRDEFERLITRVEFLEQKLQIQH